MSRRGRRAMVPRAVVLALIVAVAVVVSIRVIAAPPPPHIAIQATESLSVGGSPPSITLPVHGSLVLTASGKDLVQNGVTPLVSDDPDTVRPIASVAKALTALVVLDKKPMAATDAGPEYTITPQDVAFYSSSVASGGSSTFVSLGEQFSERQLLEALMLPSGNNIADTLATWAAGSVPAFVTLENTAARSLGMTSTTITDPSGFDNGTQSTASDLVRLGAAAIANPALASIVAERSVTLPNGATVPNLDTALTQPGWLGIKTGNSASAGGCFLFAVRREPSGDSNPNDEVTMIGAVVGEHSLLANATGDDDRGAAIYDAVQAVDTAMKDYVAVSGSALSATPTVAGSVTTDWGNTSSLALGTPVVVSSTVVRSETALFVRMQAMNVGAPLSAGAQVGSIEALVGDRVVLSWPVLTARAVDGPGFLWRLEHD